MLFSGKVLIMGATKTDLIKYNASRSGSGNINNIILSGGFLPTFVEKPELLACKQRNQVIAKM